LLVEFVDVFNLSDSCFSSDLIDTLVMEPKRMKLLKALSHSFIRQDSKSPISSHAWAADFIPGKGNSQIFLLHGPPGVGKTYTAGEAKLFTLPTVYIAMLIPPQSVSANMQNGHL
jgi:hypothetical protein